MYTLKSIAQRSTTLGAAFALVLAAVVPSASVFADALNPLTERSLLLSSSAPGWQDTDGSGNSTYAPAGSGPNGKKTGETFTFTVSSDAGISGMSLQYCTKAAGMCQAPGDNTGDADIDDNGTIEAQPHADNTRLINEGVGGGWASNKSDLNVVGTFAEAVTAVPTAGQFVVTVNGTQSTGWAMTGLNAESEDTLLADLDLTGKNNMIHLAKSTGGAEDLDSGDVVQVKFQPSDAVFITNPGSKSFFVKINTYNVNTTNSFIPTVPYATNANIVDGGVTVANVMTDSIHITTKVLETMSFSVGTRNPDTVTFNCTGYTGTPQQIAAGCKDDENGTFPHTRCDAIQQIENNRLSLGDPSAEYSLETAKAYDVNSYWRLSSNSSGGASVYYSGATLSNTVGDQIDAMATETNSTPGGEQFGLGFVDANLDTRSAEFIADQPAIDAAGISSAPLKTLSTQAGAQFPAGQLASADYDEATGTIDDGIGGSGTAKFQFDANSLTVPALMAQENDDVISCATAKIRYVANIGADTPAGVYTTKINYLAAPQY